MPSCQYCGRELGNEGAKANHEPSCAENPANQADTVPARQTQDDSQSDGGLVRAGEGAAAADSLIRVVDDDLPASERINGLRGLLAFGVDIADRYNQYRERKMEEQELRAQNVELGEPEDLPFPECKNCGYQFDETDIPLSANKVRCPECTTLYPIIDRPVEEIEAEAS